MAKQLSHVDARRDGSAWWTSARKPVTAREAVARGHIAHVGDGAEADARRRA